MLRPGSSTRSEEQEQEAGLGDENRRLHLLIAELLRKNEELRSAMVRLQDHLE
jgi:hypothetical protein